MEITYTTAEIAELQPMDIVAEAQTSEARIAALADENAQLLLEQAALEKELNQEMADHAETTQRLNKAERALILLYAGLVPVDLRTFKVANIETFDVEPLVKEASARIIAGEQREQAHKLRALPASTPAAMDALAAANHDAYPRGE